MQSDYVVNVFTDASLSYVKDGEVVSKSTAYAGGKALAVWGCCDADSDSPCSAMYLFESVNGCKNGSNVYEFLAVLQGILTYQDLLLRGQSLLIHTDSGYAKHAFARLIQWLYNGRYAPLSSMFSDISGEPLKLLQDAVEGLDLDVVKSKVFISHIKGHQIDKWIYSCEPPMPVSMAYQMISWDAQGNHRIDSDLRRIRDQLIEDAWNASLIIEVHELDIECIEI